MHFIDKDMKPWSLLLSYLDMLLIDSFWHLLLLGWNLLNNCCCLKTFFFTFWFSCYRFDQCLISPLSLKGIQAAGYEKMTLVQEATLPVILKGESCHRLKTSIICTCVQLLVLDLLVIKVVFKYVLTTNRVWKAF